MLKRADGPIKVSTAKGKLEDPGGSLLPIPTTDRFATVGRELTETRMAEVDNAAMRRPVLTSSVPVKAVKAAGNVRERVAEESHKKTSCPNPQILAKRLDCF